MMKTLKNHIKDLDFLDEDTRRTALREIEELEANGELDLGKTSTPGPSTKALVEDSVSSDSSSSSDEEPPAKKKPVTVKSAPPSKSVNNKVFNESPPSTSKPEEPRAAKLVLRISKKNDRVSSFVNSSHNLLIFLFRLFRSKLMMKTSQIKDRMQILE